MLNVTPTRSERELYDCAPDYLDGEEDEMRREQEMREARDDYEWERRRDEGR